MRKFLVVLLGVALLTAAPVSINSRQNQVPTVSVTQVQASGGVDDCSRETNPFFRGLCELGNRIAQMIDEITANW